MMIAFCRKENYAAKLIFCAILAASCRKSDLPENPARQTQNNGNQGVAGSDGQSGLGPRPNLTPHDVVRIQLEAMQNNDGKDTGILTAYRFVSPDFRKQTGTVMRFAAILRSPTYRALLGFRTAEYGPVRMENEHADQIVLLEDDQGNIDMFLFELIKLDDGPQVDCWMTNGIHPNSLDAANQGASISCCAEFAVSSK